MTRNVTRYTVSFRSDMSTYMAGFFDMMRYEGGRVVSWEHESDDFGRNRWTVEVEVETFRFTPDRWYSFGMNPVVKSTTDVR